MEKNNGKIAIAIVAMFVVALSIVGFTYAYFVANVTGNEETNVTVTAGILEVEYTTTTGSTLVAENLVPGWKNNSKRYYSEYGFAEETKINPDTNLEYTEKQYAACAVEGEALEYDEPAGCNTANGLADATNVSGPLTFTVTAADRNTGTANYAILLNSVVNQLDAESGDDERFTYELVCVKCGENDADVIVGTGTLTHGTPEVMVSDVQSITEGSKNYQINLSYANVATAEQKSQGKKVSGTVEVVGVVQTTDGWVDANGVIIIPANANQEG